MAASVLAYHDPDLNYHLSQAQKLNCAEGDHHGYSYSAPAIQLTTSGVKVGHSAPHYAHVKTYLPPAPAANIYAQPAVQYAAPPPPINYAQPAFSFLPQRPVTYAQQTTYPQSNYIINQQLATQREVHGYATSEGLSTYSAGRTVTPQATYAQAPIIAKITAAPLLAKFSSAPARTTYVQQNSVQQAYSFGSAAKASLNSYSAVHSGGPVVSQVFSGPTAGYAVSQALTQPQQSIARYTAIAPSAGQSAFAISSPVTKIVSAQYGAPVEPVVQYGAPAAQYQSAVQFATPTAHHAAAAAQYAAPVPLFQAQAVSQYKAPVLAQYRAPAVQYTSVASVPQYAAHVTKLATSPVVKNVHTDFIENYVST